MKGSRLTNCEVFGDPLHMVLSFILFIEANESFQVFPDFIARRLYILYGVNQNIDRDGKYSLNLFYEAIADLN